MPTTITPQGHSIIKKVIDGTHYYYVDGEFYPAVTRILDVAGPVEYGLRAYFKNNTPEDIEEKSRVSLEKGSLVHDAIEQLLNGVVLPLDNYEDPMKKLIVRFYEWYQTFKPTDYLTEQTIFSLKFKYAGTCDLVATIGDKRVLIDFKTNKNGIYFNNKLQVMAYKQAYEETTGEHIDECYVLRLGSQHKAGYEFKEIDDASIDDFMQVYNTYITMNGGKIPEPPMVEDYPKTLQLPIISLRK
jgi:hypothetical protein